MLLLAFTKFLKNMHTKNKIINFSKKPGVTQKKKKYYKNKKMVKINNKLNMETTKSNDEITTSLTSNHLFNIARGDSKNVFRAYGYNRQPFSFRLYRFGAKKIIKFIFTNTIKLRAKVNLHKKLYYIDYMLTYMNYCTRMLIKIKGQQAERLTKLKSMPTTSQSNKNLTRMLRHNKVMSNTVNPTHAMYNKYVSKYNKLMNYYTTSQSYIEHLKFYKTKFSFFHFRLFKLRFRYQKRIKWIYARRIDLRVKTNTFTFNKNRTSKWVKTRLPYRLHKRTNSYKYKRFSYYWLRYFFKRFKEIYIDKQGAIMQYKDIKKYLLCWLLKVTSYKFLTLQSLNTARGFLLYKSNKLYGKYKQFNLFSYDKFVLLADRNDEDVVLKNELRKKAYLYKNFYWRYYKSALERRKFNVLNYEYSFDWGLRPYIFVNKKHKVFYNWGDRHIYRRYPLYRYKYTLFFKFPRFADYRRLFKNQLREQHVFRYLYRLKLIQLVKYFRKATYKTKRIFELMFLKYFELRLDTVVYRLNFAWSLKHARQLVSRGLFVVNNKIVDSHKYHVGLGDIIMPIKRLRMQPLGKKYLNYVDYGMHLTWTRLFYRPIQSDQYPSHFLFNERIPAAMIITNINPDKVRYTKPFSLQFLTLSLLKYN